MSEHVDFVEQEEAGDGRRPDMIVRLPGTRFLAVDAKVSLNAYLEAIEATTEEARARALDAHVAAVRNHVRALARATTPAPWKASWISSCCSSPGIPSSRRRSSAARPPDRSARAGRHRDTPTLVALRARWRSTGQQRTLAENAQHIEKVARGLGSRRVRHTRQGGSRPRGCGRRVQRRRRLLRAALPADGAQARGAGRDTGRHAALGSPSRRRGRSAPRRCGSRRRARLTAALRAALAPRRPRREVS